MLILISILFFVVIVWFLWICSIGFCVVNIMVVMLLMILGMFVDSLMGFCYLLWKSVMV